MDEIIKGWCRKKREEVNVKIFGESIYIRKKGKYIY